MKKDSKKEKESEKNLDVDSDIQKKEKELYILAMNLAEQQIREGTASAQVITHFLKAGSTKEKLEKEILSEQKKLVKAKTEAIHTAKIVEELYSNAIDAFKKYGGDFDSEES